MEHFARWKFCSRGVKYSHEIVGTHRGALLPKRASGACCGSKIPRVYRPLRMAATVYERDNCGADILVLCPQLTQRITGKAFQIPLRPDWQIDNDIFNWLIMTSTQILVHMWGLGQGFRRCFSDGLEQRFSFFCGAGLHALSKTSHSFDKQQGESLKLLT